MNEIKKIEPLAYDHLMERDPKTWSKAFFQTDRACDAYENGVSESFNSIIGAARKRPLITMLEEIRIYVTERLCRQKSKGSSWGDLNICPTIRLKLSKIKELQRLVVEYLLYICLTFNYVYLHLSVCRQILESCTIWLSTI